MEKGSLCSNIAPAADRRLLGLPGDDGGREGGEEEEEQEGKEMKFEEQERERRHLLLLEADMLEDIEG